MLCEGAKEETKQDSRGKYDLGDCYWLDLEPYAERREIWLYQHVVYCVVY